MGWRRGWLVGDKVVVGAWYWYCLMSTEKGKDRSIEGDSTTEVLDATIHSQGWHRRLGNDGRR